MPVLENLTPVNEEQLSPAELDLRNLQEQLQQARQEPQLLRPVNEAESEPEPEPEPEPEAAHSPQSATFGREDDILKAVLAKIEAPSENEPEEVRKLKEAAGKVKIQPYRDDARRPQLWQEEWPNEDDKNSGGLWWKIIVVVVLLVATSAVAYFMLFAPADNEEKPSPEPAEQAAPDDVKPEAVPEAVPAPDIEEKKEVAKPPTPEKAPEKDVAPPAPASSSANSNEDRKPSPPKAADQKKNEDKEYMDIMVRARNLIGERKLDEAMALYYKSLEIKPGASYSLLGISKVWLEKGDLEKSYEFAKKSAAASSRNDQAWLMLGTVCQYLGKNDEARAAYEKFLKLKPQGQTSDEVRDILKSM